MGSTITCETDDISSIIQFVSLMSYFFVCLYLYYPKEDTPSNILQQISMDTQDKNIMIEQEFEEELKWLEQIRNVSGKIILELGELQYKNNDYKDTEDNEDKDTQDNEDNEDEKDTEDINEIQNMSETFFIIKIGNIRYAMKKTDKVKLIEKVYDEWLNIYIIQNGSGGKLVLMSRYDTLNPIKVFNPSTMEIRYNTLNPTKVFNPITREIRSIH